MKFSFKKSECLSLKLSVVSHFIFITMLIDLSKQEIKYLVEVLKLNNTELLNQEETDFSSNLYLKLRNISNACTCKEDSNVK